MCLTWSDRRTNNDASQNLNDGELRSCLNRNRTQATKKKTWRRDLFNNSGCQMKFFNCKNVFEEFWKSEVCISGTEFMSFSGQ